MPKCAARNREYTHMAGQEISELIREAMELYREQHMRRRTSLRNRHPARVGGPIQPLTGEDDILARS